MNMFKIYTPKAWYATFGYPSLYIEDDGLIFSEEDYYKSFRNAVGKIDFDSGFVYGPDYFKHNRQPIGKIDYRSDGVTQIYGPDYFKSFAQPILYIRENRIYAADQFYRMFPQEAGYVKADPPKTAAKQPASPAAAPSQPQELSSQGSVLTHILIIGLVIAIFIFIPILVAKDSTYGVPAVIMLGIGTALALIFSKSYGSSVATICVTCGILMFIYDYIATSSHKTIGTWELIGSILLYPIVICLAFLVPALILGGLVMLVKWPFLKKKQGKKSESELH